MSVVQVSGVGTAPGPVNDAAGAGADGDNNWLVHEFDNITLIDNAPYVGLRKVDSLIRYLLVRAG